MMKDSGQRDPTLAVNVRVTPARRKQRSVQLERQLSSPPSTRRDRMIWLLRELIHLLAAAGVIGAASLLVSRLELAFTMPSLLVILAIALVAALFYLMLRRAIQWALDVVFRQVGLDWRQARFLRQALAELHRINADVQASNQQLERNRQEMERLDAVKTDFVTIASHELRTPLSQIRGYTDIIDTLNEGGLLDQAQTASMIGNLRKAIDRMEELIAAMLDVSQLDVNAMDLRFSPVTIESAVRMAIEPLHEAIRQRKMTLVARGLKGLAPIEADQQRLVQALRNVIVNALKFTPDGGRIEINGSLVPARDGGDEHVLIAITDTGVGIAPENLSLIFEKFYRAADPGLHSTGAYKFMGAGPGLGLTIARGVIHSHGGEIWAESPGYSRETLPGSTFYILLPLRQPADARRVMSIDVQAARPDERIRSLL